MRKTYLYILLFVAAMMAVSCNKRTSENEEGEEQLTDEELMREVRYQYGLRLDSFIIKEGEVQAGETLGGLLNRLGAPAAKVNQLALIPADAFDVRKFQAGKEYAAFYSIVDTTLTYFVYKKGITEDVIFHLDDSLHVERQIKEVKRENRTAAVTIESSLWAALEESGHPVQLALELSELYQWTVSFFNLQKGDSIRAYYECLSVDDTISLGVGKIYGSRLYHAGKWYSAYYFDAKLLVDSTQSTAGAPQPAYYTKEGGSCKKAFLKAPLNYKRISSTFTYHRKHPIFGVVRPHTGVDYAAPTGTPVVTIGDGVVIDKGWRGGGGNTLKIKHNETYTTAYLHLSKFAAGIEKGTRVSQGQLIGYVGSTGNSTGPHLDFRIWKDGKPIDPLHMDSPTANPLPANWKTRFVQYTDSIEKFLK